MNRIGSDFRIILQTEQDDGSYLCECISGIPVVTPALIVISTVGSPDAKKIARVLRYELISALQMYSSEMNLVPPPCRGHIGSPSMCHAYSEASCQKLLIVIGDNTTPFPLDPSHPVNSPEWASSDETFRLMPVFPAGTSVTGLMSRGVSDINAVFYEKSISEVTPAVLSVASVTAEDFRVFVSYRRKDTQSMAAQLSDALFHAHFDVFLDRFSVPPSVDFQQFLFQELADKSMVVIIESDHITASPWTLQEINFAKTFRLGILALHLPTGEYIEGIDSEARETIGSNDFRSPRSRLLKNVALQRIVARIKHEHGKALLRRRHYMRGVMAEALSLQGVRDFSIDSSGILRVQHNAGGGPKQYALWLTTRPPAVADFHRTHRSLDGSESGIVIGPSAHYMTPRREQIEWLSSCTGLLCQDEGTILNVASMIAGGAV